MTGNPMVEGLDKDAYEASKPSKFRYKNKSKHHRSHSEIREYQEGKGGHSSKRERSADRSKSSRRHKSKRHRRDKETRARNFNGEYQEPEHRYRESIYDGIDAEEASFLDQDAVNPDDAFRESLFDALADDEGAAYWEGVYGQPMHVYSNTRKGPDGKLEQMSDEQYAEYVRTKMWEKSHQHIVEEREARERARKKQKERRGELEKELEKEELKRDEARRQMQESLKRGEERKKTKELETAWIQYGRKWEELKQTQISLQGLDTNLQDIIPWPVVSGKRRHVCKEEIEYFFKGSAGWKAEPLNVLKIERVRWHPDKMQQRFGQRLDADTMQTITAIFQVVDRLWNDYRK